MKRTIISAAVLVLGITGAGVSMADPGPNGNNTFGLCTAYAHNSEQAKAHGKPFIALEEAAEAEDMTVEQYCAANGQKPGGGKGGGGGGKG